MFQKIKNTYKKEKLVVLAAAITIAVIPAGLLSADGIISSWNDRYVDQKIAGLKISMERDLAVMEKRARDLAEGGTFNRDILEQDIVNLLSALSLEKNQTGLSAAITDKDGFVLTRSNNTLHRGDNIFQTTPQGKLVAEKGSGKWIAAGRTSPLAMGAGHLIKERGQVIGSVLVGRALDQEAALELADRNVPLHIAFYSSIDGIISTSFADEKTNDLLNVYFSTQNNNVSEKDELEVNDINYAVTTVPFEGIEQSPGGIIIFVPSPHGAQAIVFATILTLVFLLIQLVLQKLYFRTRDYDKHITVLMAVSLVLFVFSYFLTEKVLNRTSLKVRETPYTIYNSTLHFEPEFDIVSPVFEKKVSVVVNTGGETINAVETVINFDPQKIEIVEMSLANSFCQDNFVIEKSIDNEAGQAILVCGVPTPGITARKATVMEIIIQPKGDQDFALSFGADSKVLANDGLGTNVLRASTNAFYQVAGNLAGNKVAIFSPSHPNSERWYKEKQVVIYWPRRAGATYQYAFNQSTTYKESELLPATSDTPRLRANSDGIYYFHLVRNGIEVSNFRVKVDSAEPAPPSVLVSSSNVERGEVVRLAFESNDALSGLQKSFYVKFEAGGIFLPAISPLYIPFIERGRFSVTVRAFDNANNYSDSTVWINVK